MEQELTRIQEKLQQVLKQLQLLKKERDKLQAENARLLEQQKNQEALQYALEQQLEVVRLKGQVADPAAKKDMEKRLNQYIREIDRCIALLSE